jgi:hypothetical protein
MRELGYLRYTWTAHYDDKTVIKQFTDDGKELSVSDLDANRVIVLELNPISVYQTGDKLDLMPDKSRSSFIVRVDRKQDERFIKFWQVDQQVQGVGAGAKTIREVLGIQKTIIVGEKKINVKFFVIILPNNQILITTNDNI